MMERTKGEKRERIEGDQMYPQNQDGEEGERDTSGHVVYVDTAR